MRKTREKGITLVALVITVIVMLILVGVTISMMIGDNGIFKKTAIAKEIHNEQVAKEKLELILDDLALDKYRVSEYNTKEYIDTKMAEQGIVIVGNMTIVDGWKFEIDKEQLIIVDQLGKGKENEQIQIVAKAEVSSDYVRATIQVQIAYEGTIQEVSINGEKVELLAPENGVYSITQEVDENGSYKIVVKDEDGNYKIESVEVAELTEDMEIWKKEDMENFRDKVNSGRTFETRRVTLKANIDLLGTEENKWIPIADYASNNQLTFKGTFEGNGFEIENVYINTNQSYQGLFGINEGNIQNVKVSGRIVSSGKSIGGIVGAVEEANNSEIEKCYNIAEIYATYNNAGGIVGIDHGNIKECYNTGYVHAGNQTAGGICGYKVIGKIYNCYNLGRVTGKQLIGGINGAAGKGGFETVYTYNCYNLGTLSGGNYTAQITGYPNVNGGSSLDVNCYTTNVTVEGLNEGEYSDNVWIEDNGINNGYPILKWQVNEKN